MSRYIDIDRLEPQQYENSEVELGVLAYDYEKVQSEPYIDIVFCKDCKLGGTEDCPMDEIDDEYFCNFGEREGE